MKIFPFPPGWVIDALKTGQVIPAHPLALTNNRKLDERRQRGLTHYYHAAGAGGIAVGVHTTQFAIRNPEHALYKPVLELAADTIAARDSATGRKTVMIAGIAGSTEHALTEARIATDLGYHAGLLSLAAFHDADESMLLAHCSKVARCIPLIGFYLQPAVGGRILSRSFWREFSAIPNVIAIKIAPFNRYQTLDVLRGVAESGRFREIALYTGNDDSIVADLLTEFMIEANGLPVQQHIVGGLLGHWACWARRAVELLDRIREIRHRATTVPLELLTIGTQITDCNAAFFDAANSYHGVIAGIHEVLRRQGLLANTLTLNPDERLSPGQSEEIDRVYRAYPSLNDDDFVREHLDEWLS